jgi:hypothetical protein
MKTKLVFSSETYNAEQWTNLPFIPRINEWFNVRDILKEEEVAEIKRASQSWNGIKGFIKSVEYRHDDNDFYIELVIYCNK